MGHYVSIGRYHDEPPLLVEHIHAALEDAGLVVDEGVQGRQLPAYWGYALGTAVLTPPQAGSWAAPWVSLRIPTGLTDSELGFVVYMRIMGLAKALDAHLFDIDGEVTENDVARIKHNLAQTALFVGTALGVPDVVEGNPAEPKTVDVVRRIFQKGR